MKDKVKRVVEVEEKENTFGIIGLSLGWLVPLIGIVLGIVALARGEKTKAIGWISIIEGIIFTISWASFYASLYK